MRSCIRACGCAWTSACAFMLGNNSAHVRAGPTLMVSGSPCVADVGRRLHAGERQQQWCTNIMV
eukprot:366303-Chlamydomonas_euryale.AAC.4